MTDAGWAPPEYSVDEDGRLVGGYTPSGPHNWGRFGETDTRGTANLIGATQVASAAALVQDGKVFSLAHPYGGDAPRSQARAKIQHFFAETGADSIVGSPAFPTAPGFDFNDDYVVMALQGSTQWDGLAHVSTHEALYNGYWAGTVTATGSKKVSIDQLATSFVGRGVLLDVARHKGVESLDPGFRIEPELLDAVGAAQGVDVRSGDILLVRTGHMARWASLKTQAQLEAFEHLSVPGLTGACVGWLRDKDVAAVASDTRCVEVIPSGVPGVVAPIHVGCLVDLGLTLGELWALDELAADCEADGRWEFMLIAPPLNIPGAVGSPLNPIAIK